VGGGGGGGGGWGGGGGGGVGGVGGGGVGGGDWVSRGAIPDEEDQVRTAPRVMGRDNFGFCPMDHCGLGWSAIFWGSGLCLQSDVSRPQKFQNPPSKNPRRASAAGGGGCGGGVGGTAGWGGGGRGRGR